MNNVHALHDHNAFDPDGVRVLVAAYEAALAWLPEGDFVDIPAAEVPNAVASHVIARARLGETDPHRLRDATIHAMLSDPSAAG